LAASATGPPLLREGEVMKFKLSGAAAVALALFCAGPARAETAAWWILSGDTEACELSDEGPLGLRSFLRKSPGDQFGKIETYPEGAAYPTVAAVHGSIEGRQGVWYFFRNRSDCEQIGRPLRAKLRGLE
jgi:hypothetical protein